MLKSLLLYNITYVLYNIMHQYSSFILCSAVLQRSVLPILFWVIFLKDKIFNKNVFKKALIIFCSALIFFFGAYAYLDYNLNRQTAKADQKDYSVPYNPVPDNAGIAFLLPDSSAVLAYLDFENECINVVDIEKYDNGNNLYFGYTVDFTVHTDYQLIGGIIDRIGGVNIEINGETLRYTGIQVIDLISKNYDKNIKPQIISQIFEQISKNNFSKDDFVYIIENSSSNLTIVDCIYWLDYIEKLCGRINLVN